MIEREENSPTVDTLEKLAAVLKIEPQLFFADDELISEAVGLDGSNQSTRKGHPSARERVEDHDADHKELVGVPFQPVVQIFAILFIRINRVGLA